MLGKKPGFSTFLHLRNITVINSRLDHCHLGMKTFRFVKRHQCTRENICLLTARYNYLNLKMEAGESTHQFVLIYQNSRCQITGDHNLNYYVQNGKKSTFIYELHMHKISNRRYVFKRLTSRLCYLLRLNKRGLIC